uniref:Serine/threonine-protein phosphatase n=1 Tax=Parastrongyloides trichosuri TaxID=131310 RepID=A0A0N4ZVF7_PARTI
MNKKSNVNKNEVLPSTTKSVLKKGLSNKESLKNDKNNNEGGTRVKKQSSKDKINQIVDRSEFNESERKNDARRDSPLSAYTAVIPINPKSGHPMEKNKNKEASLSFEKNCKTMTIIQPQENKDLDDEEQKLLRIKWRYEDRKDTRGLDYDFTLKSFIDKHFAYKGEIAIQYVFEEIYWILKPALEVIKSSPMLVEVDVPIIICGDIHGQFCDLIRIFNKFGKPPTKKYLFLGDYVDRGSNSLEVILLLLALKLQYPESIFLLRGNHELRHINRVYGFNEELGERIQESDVMYDIYEKFNVIFSYLPISACVSKKILCMHGGISENIISLDSIKSLKRPMETVHGLACDLLWADPDDSVEWYHHNDARGVSFKFGKSALNDFLKKLNLDMIIRGHQVCQMGFSHFNNGRLLTVFSAGEYDDEMKNLAGVIVINENYYVYPVSIKCPKTERERSRSKKNKNDITVDKTN